MTLTCISCRANFENSPIRTQCEKCGGGLEFKSLLPKNGEIKFSGALNFWRYKQVLPPLHNFISLGEGWTPLHRSRRLARKIGLRKLYLKDETRNPTNSYRDRAAALMTSNALDENFEILICATNGNLGASMAAYSAKVGLICQVIVPKVVDVGKLAQMIVYDAIIEESGEILDDSIRRAMFMAEETGWYQATAELNPLVIEAQKTIAYEVFEQFGVPDCVVVSMGSGGTIYSVWKGFRELVQLGIADGLPKIVGVQPEGCAGIVNGLMQENRKFKKIEDPYTRALAILVAEPLQGQLAGNSILESEGLALTVTDNEILAAELQIAKLEGIFAEPASSATIAAIRKLVQRGEIGKDESVVSLITGSGLKATDVLQALTKNKKTAILGLEISTKEKILRILSEKDTYGYDLWKKLGKTMTRGAVYQHLNELSGKGLIVGYEQNVKKFFKITERGKKVLRAIEDLKILM